MSVLCFSCRMFENKINELEKELAKKTSSVSELKRQLKETREREEEAQISIRQLQDQVNHADKRSCGSPQSHNQQSVSCVAAQNQKIPSS